MLEQRDSAYQELGFLGKLSIEELEALLKTSGDPNDVETFFDAVIKEVVKREKKEPTGRLPDVDAAWEELQIRCSNQSDTNHLPDASDAPSTARHRPTGTPSPKKAKSKPARNFMLGASKIAAIVLLTLVLTFSMMIGVQAFGLDMFGALARWTSDTFHFETQPSEPDSQDDLHDSVQAMLNVQGILGELAPKWYPAGSEIVKYSLRDDELGLDTHVSFTTSDGRNFFIRVRTYNDTEYIDSSISEKNPDPDRVKEYPSHGKLFYLFLNEEYIKGTWSDGKIVLSIRGNITVEELKAIIDSIGG